MEKVIAIIPQKKRWVRFLILSLISLLVLLTITTGGGYFYLTSKLPATTGSISIPNLDFPVNVTRDAQGVPHIQAQNQHDLYLAQGYITAQDRMFQMDLSRRQASGQLSEVVGEKALNRDKLFRTLGLRRAAEASYQKYSPEAKNILEWYAQGVNTYLKQAKETDSLPIEFTLLGYDPIEWTPIDSLSIGKYMAYDLGRHWTGQAFRYHILKTLPKEKALDLFPEDSKQTPTILSDLQQSNIDITQSLTQAVIAPEWNGSNNWVVSGEKSATGKPILADDPHLSLATPAIWYQTHLQSPELNVSGVIFAGIPGIILGHNEQIAWGVTNVDPDVQDLYIEKRNPKDPTQFLYKDQWEKATIINEKILIKDKPPIDYSVTVTRHGPVISEFTKDQNKDTVLAMKWTALEPTTELEAIFKMNQSRDWESFKKALTYFQAPAQNFVFASQNGDIAYRANGKIPIRKGNHLTPVPGWTGEYEWTSFIPWDELPTIVNPPEGFISTANNKVVNDSYPYHISHIWAQPYRAKRILEFLTSKEKLTVQDMQKLQMDQKNLQAAEFLPMFLLALDRSKLSPKEKETLQLFQTWDYQDNKDTAAPLIFHLWMEEISKLLFDKEIPSNIQELFEGKSSIVDQLLRHAHEGKPGPWVQQQGGLSSLLTKSYQQTIQQISQRFGNDYTSWKWGDYHQLIFEHPLSSVTALKYLFNFESPIPMGGSRVTVQAAGYQSDTGKVNHGASWRFVASLDNLNQAWHLVGPGQSGNVLSPWYHDQVESWVQGNYHITKLSNITGDTLQLIPDKKK